MRLERRQACITDITSSLSSLVTCNSRIGSDHSAEGLFGVIPAKACWGSPRRRPVGVTPAKACFGVTPAKAGARHRDQRECRERSRPSPGLRRDDDQKKHSQSLQPTRRHHCDHDQDPSPLLRQGPIRTPPAIELRMDSCLEQE